MHPYFGEPVIGTPYIDCTKVYKQINLFVFSQAVYHDTGKTTEDKVLSSNLFTLTCIDPEMTAASRTQHFRVKLQGKAKENCILS